MFINASFKKLRSAEGAFDMLLNFKKIKSREAINKQARRTSMCGAVTPLVASSTCSEFCAMWSSAMLYIMYWV